MKTSLVTLATFCMLLEYVVKFVPFSLLADVVIDCNCRGSIEGLGFMIVVVIEICSILGMDTEVD